MSNWTRANKQSMAENTFQHHCLHRLWNKNCSTRHTLSHIGHMCEIVRFYANGSLCVQLSNLCVHVTCAHRLLNCIKPTIVHRQTVEKGMLNSVFGNTLFVGEFSSVHPSSMFPKPKSNLLICERGIWPEPTKWVSGKKTFSSCSLNWGKMFWDKMTSRYDSPNTCFCTGLAFTSLFSVVPNKRSKLLSD